MSRFRLVVDHLNGLHRVEVPQEYLRDVSSLIAEAKRSFGVGVTIVVKVLQL